MKMISNFKKILLKEEFFDFVQKLLVATSVVYMGLFAAEAFLPGTIVEVFNINLLLLLFLLQIFYLIWALKNEEIKKDKFSFGVFFKFFIFSALIVIVFLTLFVVQYKISIPETLLYIFLAFFCGKLLKDNI